MIILYWMRNLSEMISLSTRNRMQENEFMTNIQKNLIAVEQEIQRACDKSGRNRTEVSLIAVSKTKPISMIQEALMQA